MGLHFIYSKSFYITTATREVYSDFWTAVFWLDPSYCSTTTHPHVPSRPAIPAISFVNEATVCADTSWLSSDSLFVTVRFQLVALHGNQPELHSRAPGGAAHQTQARYFLWGLQEVTSESLQRFDKQSRPGDLEWGDISSDAKNLWLMSLKQKSFVSRKKCSFTFFKLQLHFQHPHLFFSFFIYKTHVSTPKFFFFFSLSMTGLCGPIKKSTGS